jgi:Ni,Fe-hydrogenase III small subunit
MIVAGWVSQKMAPVLRQLYDQMPEPKWVELYWCLPVESGVAPAAVVEALDVFEDRVCELDVGVPVLPVEQLGLHAAPERLRGRSIYHRIRAVGWDALTRRSTRPAAAEVKAL